MAAVLLQHVEIELPETSRNIQSDPKRVLLSVLHPKGEVQARIRLQDPSYTYVPKSSQQALSADDNIIAA